MTVIDEVKARINLLDLLGPQARMRKSGAHYIGFCPFHDNKHTPAFVVWPDTNTWRCFGACAEGGDLFKFVMKRDNCDFSEALKTLAAQAGVELRPRTAADQQRDETTKRLRGLLQQAATYYHHLLQNAPQAAVARQQLADRGITREAILNFELGYALNDFQATCTYLRDKGFSDDELIAAGLLGKSEQGHLYDRFRHRIMIPIRDDAGHPVGFGARIVNPDDSPKYLNSPQTDLFNKSQLLYGLDRAKKAIREHGVAVVVEGYMDVIAVHQAGFANVVAPMGTALTETQLKLIKRGAKKLVLALDGDPAGLKATLRGLETARHALEGDVQFEFDPRGLVRAEGHLELDIRVAVLPDGKDPDDVVRESPQAWTDLIENAQHIALFVLQTLAADRDLKDPKVVGELVNEVLPIINEVGNRGEQAVLRQRLASFLGLDERDLARWAPEMRRKTSARPRPAVGAPPVHSPAFVPPPPEAPPDEIEGHPASVTKRPIATPRASAVENYCLGVLARYPHLLPQANRILREAQLAPLDVEDFSGIERQMIFETVRKSLVQDQAEPADYVFQSLDAALHATYQHVIRQAADFDPDRQQVRNFQREVLRLREEGTVRWLQQLQREMAQAQATGDTEAIQLLANELGVGALTRQRIAQARKPR